MKKKQEEVSAAHVLNYSLEDIMSDRFARYSKYIIQDRALPDARDGLKPVQRRILYAMYEDGNTWDKPYRKSAKTVGLVIGNYHPHGDSSVYDAMVRMSQDWKIRIPEIDMQGNNGSIDDDPAAAMRYTEARLGKISEFLLTDIEKETVSWAYNFDDTAMEPTVLPAGYPNLLVNGISGIAAGYATNIPPHNLNEVIEACIYRINHPHCSLDELMQFVKGPDFPTGGIVQGIDGIKEAFETGKGKIIIRSKVAIEEQKTMNQIIVSEIPYEVIKSNMVKKIDDIRLNKKIDGLLDVRDESDRNGLRIVVDVKKESNVNTILNYLYKNSDLQVSYSYNVIAIVNKRPMQLGLAAMLDAFINHRRDVIEKRSTYELNQKLKRCHILEGLKKAISILDEIIAIIRSSKDKTDSKNRIMDAYDFSETQAEAIVTMRLYRLSNTDITALIDELDRLQQEIEELKVILSNSKKLNQLMIKELKKVAKSFDTPRLTKIEDEIEEIVIEKQDMITSEQVMGVITRDGYVKKVSLRSYQAASSNQSGKKEEDQLISYGEVNTLDKMIFFTQLGTYGYLPIYELKEAKWKDVGFHLNTYLKISANEKIINAFALKHFQSEAYLISISKEGNIKRTRLNEYEVSRNNKTMANMKIASHDEVIKVLLAYEMDEVLLLSEKGYLVRYSIEDIPLTAPKSKGVRAMKLVDDGIVDACIYDGEGSSVVIFTNDYGVKRIKLSEIDITSRPARGSMICKKTKTKPYLMKKMGIYALNDQINFYNEENKVQVVVKDIPLMSKDATFSSMMKNDGEYYEIVPLPHIKMVELKPMVEDDPTPIENMSLFEEDEM